MSLPLRAGVVALIVLMVVFWFALPQGGNALHVQPANPELILATTTSTQDSGLLDYLLPIFQNETGYQVKTIAVGSGQAMLLGQRGEADVLLVHAPASEQQFMANGYGVNRKLVMHNDFIILGPAADPARVKSGHDALEALKQIASTRSLFFSRGDNSGTNQLENQLWDKAKLKPAGDWYQSTGQGMGATLNVASEKNGYTISDRATYLALKKNLHLDMLLQGDPALLNIYHVIEVNPALHLKVNVPGAQAFSDFLLAPRTQAQIANFGKDKFGETLFFPDADKPEY